MNGDGPGGPRGPSPFALWVLGPGRAVVRQAQERLLTTPSAALPSLEQSARDLEAEFRDWLTAYLRLEERFPLQELKGTDYINPEVTE